MTPDDYDFTGRSCTNTYCHAAYAAGTGAGGGAALPAEAVPVWNVVDGTYSACGVSCHLNPTPTTNHLATDTDCERSGCHSGVMQLYDTANPDQSTWVDKDLHMNGIVEFDGM
jgi:predicted CxxxxCH...CXXCH cytochrome family protein